MSYTIIQLELIRTTNTTYVGPELIPVNEEGVHLHSRFRFPGVRHPAQRLGRRRVLSGFISSGKIYSVFWGGGA